LKRFELNDVYPDLFLFQIKQSVSTMANSNQSSVQVNLGNTVVGSISSAAPIQSYSFTPTQSSTYYLSFVAPASNQTSSQNIQSNSAVYNISIVDSNGRTLDAFSTSQLNTSPTLFFNLNAGSFTVQISQPIGSDTDQYKFQLGQLNLNTINPTKIEFKAGLNSPPSSNLSASIKTSSPIQVFSFNLNAGDLASFTCSSSSSSSQLALTGQKLSLLDSRGNLLENNNATLSLQQVGLAEQYINADPSIQLIAPYSGTYYLTVDTPVSSGSFNLNAQLVDKPELLKGIVNQMGGNPNDGYWKSTPGKTLNLTYSFMTKAITPNTSSGYDSTKPLITPDGFAPMTSSQQQAVVSALNVISSLCNVKFTLTTNESAANILYATSSQTGSSGSTFVDTKNDDGSYKQVSVFISNFFPSVLNSLSTIGGFGFNTLLHESAHALGLKHPGAYDSASKPLLSDSYKYYTPIGWDNTQFSIMSYVFQQTSLPFNSSYASLDIAALQSTYGPPSNSSVVTFTVSPTTPIYTSAPIGLMGSVIDISNQTKGSILSLTEGTYSSIGLNADGTQQHDNIVIPWGSQYTNVITSFNGGDIVYCNKYNDTILLNGGNDFVFGGDGVVTVKINSLSSNFKVSRNGNVLVFSDTTGKFGDETLIGVSRVVFNNNSATAYDLNGNAGQVAKVLGVVFGKNSISNKSYIGIGLSLLDGGMTYSNLAALAVKTSGATTPDQIVTQLWSNVFGTAPQASDKEPFIGLLNNGTTIGDLTVLAANTSFNLINIDLNGLSQNGIQYNVFV